MSDDTTEPDAKKDEGEDLKLTVILTWKEESDLYDLPGVKSRAEEMSDYLTELFSDSASDFAELLHAYEGSYSVKVEPLPEGEL